MNRYASMIIITTTIVLGLSSETDASGETEPSSIVAPAKWHLLPEKSPQDRTEEAQPNEPASTYSTEIEAVLGACNKFNPVSIEEDREYIGAVLKHKSENRYIYTAAAGQQGQDRISAEITIPENYELVSFWHTHGAGDGSRHYFSKFDTSLVKQWEKPLYLADSSGRLKVFKPGDRKMSLQQARKAGLGHARGSATGSLLKDPSGKVLRVKTKN